jgi:hypothetical protein
VNDLSFVQDDRVDIVAPKERAEVALPVQIRWTVEDFAVGPGQGSFGVLVDREPPRPGKTLLSLFSNSEECRGQGGAQNCSGPDFLATRGAFQTTETAVTIDRLPDTGDDGRREFHEVTVVLLDEDGRRVGESGWTVQFEVKERVQQ